MRSPITSALCVALALSVGAAAQQDPLEKKPPSKRDLRLQKAVDEMVRIVEKYAQLEFETPPRVRAAKHKEWRELIQREFEIEGGRELFQMSVSTLGVYLARSKEIVLSPLVVAPLIKELDDDAPRHTRKAVAHQKATIAHEIVHALQEVHFGLPSKLEAATEIDEILRYKWLIEGHAVLVEELIAERELGLEDFMLTGPYGGLAVGLDPSYVRGRNYFLHVLRTEGMKGVHQRLKQPPTHAAMKELAKKPLPKQAQPEAGQPKTGQPKKGQPKKGPAKEATPSGSGSGNGAAGGEPSNHHKPPGSGRSEEQATTKVDQQP
jgi:hypothetical protein